MLINRKTFEDYACCNGGLAVVDFILKEAGVEEMEYDELMLAGTKLVDKPPLNISKDLMQYYFTDPQMYIGDSQVIRKFIETDTSKNVKKSIRIKNCKNIRWAKDLENCENIMGTGKDNLCENLKNCYYCISCKDSQNLLFCNNTYGFNNGYAICNRVVSKERFYEVLDKVNATKQAEEYKKLGKREKFKKIKLYVLDLIQEFKNPLSTLKINEDVISEKDE